ncbi:MAG: tRNA pseudouridine(38-40) synthase TruA [Gemmatimonadetes bacterium]|nr:tRNA pseudouridine(38-40) synthase TruA [Gemmatimonadota bacterium]MDA1102852.1 tRNA pseudouridine(38-40) synthase TruA [Gemmatimonadota bacterium]
MDAPETIRIRLTVHYDGAAFHGWQVQPDHRTVQGDLEAALSRLADRPCTVTGSGRTDTGVHATGQVATVDMPLPWTGDKLRRSLNAVLSGDVWIESAHATRADFHPRFDAVRRTYRYEVGLRPDAPSPFHRRWCWPLDDRLDPVLLKAAADCVVGEHSFEAFAKSGQPERGYRCRIASAEWSETPLGVRLTITADRYLHHMVRYLVGTMVDISRGRRSLDDMARLLGNDPDLTTSPPAPAEGLFLDRVEYPDDPTD